MKLSDSVKKRLTIAGLGVVCVVLIIAISSQFKAKQPEDALTQPSSTVSDVDLTTNTPTPTPTTEPSKEPTINVQSVESTPTPTQVADTGKSTGTEQSIQGEVTKPAEPTQKAKTDPTKTPDGKKVDTVTPVEHDKVTKPANDTSSSSPKSGDKKDGKIYVPGFGWIEDNGGGGSGTAVGNPGDELTGNKVGSME